MSTDPLFVAGVGSAVKQVAAASSTGDQTICTATGDGWVVGRIMVATNNNNGPRTLAIKRLVGGVTVQMGMVTLPDLAGYSVGVGAVDVISLVFGDIPINLAKDESLVLTLDAALNTSKVMDVHVEYAPL